MSSSPERRSTDRRSGADRRNGPRVGIIRGAVATDRPVTADVRTTLPTQVLDPVAIETMRRDAEDAGYHDGYAAGLARADQESAAARHAYDQQFMDAMSALMGAATQLQTREAATLHDLADQTAALALQIAEIVLQREIAASSDPGREAITRALQLVPEEGDITIRMHPEDLAVLAPVDDLAPGRGIALVADPGIQRGGAILAVGATRIDAQLTSALERIAEVLR